MDGRQSFKPLAIALLACGCAALLAVAGEFAASQLDPANARWARLAFDLGGAAAAGVILTFLLSGLRRGVAAAARGLDELARLDPADLHGDEAERFEQLPAGHPLAGAISRLRDAVLANYQESCDLLHAQTAAEVRCRRAQQEAEQARAILSELPDPILVVNDQDALVMANHKAEELLQIDEADPAQRGLDRLVRCEKLVDLLLQTSRRRQPGARTEDLEIVDGDGQARHFRATASRVAAESRSGGTVAVLKDIGEHKALQKRNAEFVSAVSHEMKTPLAGIKAYVELLADGDATDEATREEFLGIINGQADRLQRLIDNLLNLARIEAGVVKVNKEPRSLNDVLEESLRVVRPAAEAKRITLTGELSAMYLGVLADRDMLLQAAINLLSNAIKYTAEGGSVCLRSRLSGGEVCFEVQDTGVGLSEEDAQRVFEKFYRVKKNKDMAPGTGLGLPLAKHIVEDVHGGRIVVQSRLGEGSTFGVVLPAAGQLVHS